MNSQTILPSPMSFSDTTEKFSLSSPATSENSLNEDHTIISISNIIINAMKAEEPVIELQTLFKSNLYSDEILVETIQLILQQEIKNQPQDSQVRGMTYLINTIAQENLTLALFKLFSSTLNDSNNSDFSTNFLCQAIKPLPQLDKKLASLMNYINPMSGDTIFHLAAKACHENLILICYNHQGDPFLNNQDDETPFYWIGVHHVKNKSERTHQLWTQLINHPQFKIAAILTALEKAIAVSNKQLERFLFETLANTPADLKDWEKSVHIKHFIYSIQYAAVFCQHYDLVLNFIERRCKETTEDNPLHQLYNFGYAEYRAIYQNLQITHEDKQQSYESKSYLSKEEKNAYNLCLLMDSYDNDNALAIACSNEFYNIAGWLLHQRISNPNHASVVALYRTGEYIYTETHKILRTINSQPEIGLSKIEKDALIALSTIITDPDDSGMIDKLRYLADTIKSKSTTKLNSLAANLLDIVTLADEILHDNLEKHKNILKTNPEHNSPSEEQAPASTRNIALLHRAIKVGNFDIIQSLLAHNQGLVNAVDSNGLSALHHLARYNNDNQAKISKLLLKQKAQLQVDLQGTYREYESVTPLWIATSNASFPVINDLLDRDANPNLADTTRNLTPLYNLITSIPTPEAKNLRPIVSEEVEPSWLRNYMLAISKLLHKGADYNHIANTNISIFHQAVYCGNLNVVNKLIESGANIAVEANKVKMTSFGVFNKVTPIFFSTSHTEVMVALLDKYAAANIKPIPAVREDNTPITLSEVAIKYENRESLVALCARQDFFEEIYTLASNFFKQPEDYPSNDKLYIADTLIDYLLENIKNKNNNQNLFFNLSLSIIKNLDWVIKALSGKKVKSALLIKNLSNLRNTDGESLLDICVKQGTIDTAITFIKQLETTKPHFSRLYQAGIQSYQEALHIKATKEQMTPEEHQDITQSLLALNKVLLNPADKTASAELKRIAYAIAPGKPSFWKKFIGTLLAVASIALSIVATLFTFGITVIVPTAIVGLTGCGIFANGLQQKGLCKQLTHTADIAEQTNAKALIKN